MSNTHGIQRLLDIMAALRDPQSGCPWDLEQTFASIAPIEARIASSAAPIVSAVIVQGRSGSGCRR